MPTIRAVRPTDLIALLSFANAAYPNQAVTQDGLGKGKGYLRPLDSLIQQWPSFATGRHTWINVRGQTVQGLISVRQRAKSSVWEVEYLISSMDNSQEINLTLLEHLSQSAAHMRVGRIFLRLPASSDALEPARKAGFIPYAKEQLLSANPSEIHPVPRGDIQIRQFTAEDLYSVFRVYECAVPQAIRQLEGLTFHQWQEAREAPWRHAADLVAQRHGAVIAWLRLSNSGPAGRFDPLVHPDHLDALDDLLVAILSHLAQCNTISVLLAHHQQPIMQRLKELGFSSGEEFIRLARPIARPIIRKAAAERVSPTRVYSPF